jgi:large subunit ribosomal protein L31
MKSSIHPQYVETTVHCNGCNTTFTTHSTVPSITVELCSNCHPFYTGKQKLLDIAGRVDKFNARRDAATKLAATKAKADAKKAKDTESVKIEENLEAETVDVPTEESTTEA